MKLLLTVLLCAASVQSYAASKPHISTFSAKSFLIADCEGQIFKEQDGSTIRPIASISKLMVAELVSEQNLNEELDIPKVRKVQSGIPYSVKQLTRKELLTLALIKSDNFAAQILCLNLPDCVNKMNEKAVELGMTNTHYVEPTGLSVENVSTAHDLLKLVMVASQNATITDISHRPSAEIDSGKSKIKIRNTNPLTSTLDILMSKTGFTDPAGGCLVMVLHTPFGNRVLIILGSKNAHSRIPDMQELIKGLI